MKVQKSFLYLHFEKITVDKLIKTTAKELSGVEKAAILLAEIGPLYNNNYVELEKALNLTPTEMRKIRKTMEKLGQYHPARHGMKVGMAEIKKEEAVLEEVIDFGKRRGIFHPVEKKNVPNQYINKDLTYGLADIAKNDPEVVAKILASWIGEKNIKSDFFRV